MTRADAERIAEAACEAAGLSWRTLPHVDRAAAVQAVEQMADEIRAARTLPEDEGIGLSADYRGEG